MPKAINSPSVTVITDVQSTDRLPMGRVGSNDATVYEMSTVLAAAEGEIDGGTASTIHESFDDIDGGDVNG